MFDNFKWEQYDVEKTKEKDIVDWWQLYVMKEGKWLNSLVSIFIKIDIPDYQRHQQSFLVIAYAWFRLQEAHRFLSLKEARAFVEQLKNVMELKYILGVA